jgi:hypothetical protein
MAAARQVWLDSGRRSALLQWRARVGGGAAWRWWLSDGVQRLTLSALVEA